MERISNLLILRGGALGDFLLTLPAVAALHRRWPSAAIDLVADSRFADLAIGSGWVRKFHSLDSALMAQLYVSDAEREPALAESIRGYDAALCYLADPAQTIAQTLDQAGIRRQVFISPRVIHGHAVDHFMGALQELGVEMKGDDSAMVRLRPEVERAAIAVRLSEPGAFAVIHPGSGSARKNWPLDRFIGLADRIRRELAIRPVFLLGEAEERIEPILRKAAPSVLCLAKLELMDVAAILKRAQFYIGNDSGITHLAASLGVPTWALFGPTDPAQWAPRGLRVQVVRSSDRGLHPMDDLAENTVWEALKVKNGGGPMYPGGVGRPRPRETAEDRRVQVAPFVYSRESRRRSVVSVARFQKNSRAGMPGCALCPILGTHRLLYFFSNRCLPLPPPSCPPP